MPNPFDQFDKQPNAAPAQAAPPQGAAQAPVSAQPAQPNVFDNPDATAAAMPTAPDDKEMSRQFYKMLNEGAKPAKIFEWARSVGRPLDLTDAQKDSVASFVTYRDKQRDRGIKGDLFKDAPELVTDERLGSLMLPQGSVTASDLGAVVRRGANNVLFNFGDELMSAVRAPFQSLSNGESIGRNYRDNWLEYNAQDETDQAARPTASNVGLALGIAGSAPIGIATAGRGLLARTLVGGGEGAVQGALNATGEGAVDDRFGDTGSGALLGGTIGAALPGALAATGRATRPVIERLPGADSAKALARRLGLNSEDIEDMRVAAREQEELTGPDSVGLIDVLPASGRDVVGAAGRRDGGREAIQEASRARELAAPARIQDQARRISPETRTPDELRSDILNTRDAEIKAALDPIRATPLPLEQGVVDVLATGTGLKAIRAAINNSEDVATRNQLEELYAGLRDLRRSVDPRLPEATQQRLQNVRVDGLPFTIDMSDKISRELNREGRYAFGNTVRDSARLAPRYNEIMDNYAAASRRSEAVGVGSGERTVVDPETGRTVTERAQGQGFLDETSPGRYESRMDRLSDERAPIPPTPQRPLQNVETYDHPSGDQFVNAEYVTPDGDTTRLMFRLHPDGTASGFTVGNKGGGMGGPGDEAAWDEVANTVGPAGMRDMLAAVRQQFPQINRIQGERVTGASAGTGAANVDMPLRPLPTAPSERDLAAAGAASTVREDPLRAARQITGDPNTQSRLAATVGPEEATTIRRAMDAELNRVRRLREQAPGPRGAPENMHAEGLVNALYNPTSPISWGREALRFMNKIGMTDRDAQWIVENSVNPQALPEVLNRLEKAGLDRQRAEAYADLLRVMATRAATTQEK